MARHPSKTNRAAAGSPDPANLPRTRRGHWLLFFLANLLLASYFLDHGLTPNPMSRTLPVIALVKDGSLVIDEWHEWTQDKSFVHGHYYSDKAPMSSLVVAPFYWVLSQFEPVTGDNQHFAYYAQTLGDMVCGSVPFCLLLLISWLSFKKGRRCAGPIAMVGWYGGFLFLYAGTYFGHLLAALFLVLAYKSLAERKDSLGSGLWLGAAFMTEYPLAVVFPIWLFQVAVVTRSPKEILKLGVGFLPGLAAALAYNYAVGGDPFTMPYNYVADPEFSQMTRAYGFLGPRLESLWGLTFGLSRGLFVYAPGLLVLGIIWGLRQYAESSLMRRWLRSYGVGFSIGYLALISSYYMWDGGWAYGPRHLIPLAALWLYRGLPLLKSPHQMLAFLSLSTLGLACTLLAKLTAGYMIPQSFTAPLWQFLLPQFMSGKWNADNIATEIFGLTPLASGLVWLCLFGLFMIRLHAAHGHKVETT